MTFSILFFISEGNSILLKVRQTRDVPWGNFENARSGSVCTPILSPHHTCPCCSHCWRVTTVKGPRWMRCMPVYVCVCVRVRGWRAARPRPGTNPSATQGIRWGLGGFFYPPGSANAIRRPLLRRGFRRPGKNPQSFSTKPSPLSPYPSILSSSQIVPYQVPIKNWNCRIFVVFTLPYILKYCNRAWESVF